MSRNLVYVNGQNESITFETGPYLIVKIEGLGIPNVDRQEQKAPYQDGTTYIDSLLQNRDIVVELAITKPNDFENIALYRRQLSQRLCPKYGLGTLTYTDEDGNAYNIRAVVSSMVFPNKDYRDPYMRAMVTFTACDPYWKDTTTDSNSLPTSVNSSESTFSNSGYYPQIIQKTNNELLGFFIRDPYLTLICESSASGTSWAGLSTVEADQISGFSVIKQSDDVIRILYTRVTDGYIYQRTSSDSGATWSARTPVVSSATNGVMRIKQINDGSFIVLFSNGTNIYKTSSATGATWAAPTVTNLPNDGYFDVFNLTDGSYSYAGAISTKVDYRRSLDAITWTLISNVITSTTISGAAINESGNISTVYYTQGSPSSAMYSKFSNNSGATWSDASSLGNGPTGLFGIIRQSNNAIRIVYTTGFPFIIKTYTRSVTPVPAVITGDVPAPFVVTFQGPSVNPRIINQNTLEYIRLNTTLAAADHFDVDTSFGNKTVKLTQGGIVKNGIAFLDIGSTFFQLARPTLPSLPIGVNPYRGLKAYWNMDSVPEIPDDPAGVTYLQDAWATVDGWDGAGDSILTVDGGRLISTVLATKSAWRVVKTASFGSGKTYRIKLFSSKSGDVGIIADIGAGAVLLTSIPVVANQEKIIDYYIAGNVTTFHFRQAALVPGDYASVDFIYIGTGAYLPNSLIDNSGNGNHGTIYGATPVEGISGKALAFDGVNDYTSVVDFPIPDIFHFGVELPFGHSSTTIYQPFLTVNGTSLFIARPSSSDQLQIWNGSGAGQILSFPSFFTGFLATRLRLDVTMNFITGVVVVYRNGVYFGTGTWLIPVKPVGYQLRFGGTSPYWLTGTIDEPRIYNRAPSAEEVKYLYDNPGVPIPADATVVYFEDDAVASTATATMEWTERYVGL